MIRYDALSADFYDDRASIFAQLRDQEPVSLDDETGIFTLSRYEDVAAAALDWETYSCVGPWTSEDPPMPGKFDPPEHTALRNKLTKALSAERMLAMEDDLRADARATLEVLVAQGECDLKSDYIVPCLGRVEGRLLDLTDEQVGESIACADLLIRAIPGEPEQAPTVQERLPALFFPLIGARKAAPGNDLISALVTEGADGGDGLTDPEIFGFLVNLFFPLVGLTPCAVANSVALIGAHTEQRAELVADPALIPRAFEEAMRLDAPQFVANQVRVLTRDVTLHGVALPTGAKVHLLWGAANLDERVLENPDQFDLHRDGFEQLSFGHGVHECLGRMLAGLEARVLLEELLSAAPDYSVTESGPRIRSNWILGQESLNVSFA